MTVLPLFQARRAALAALAALLALGLVACGGGGDSSPPAPVLPLPSVTLGVLPATLVQGQSASLTWTASAGSTCTASGGWSGAQAISGTSDVTPTAAGTAGYTLTCAGSGAYAGSTVQTANVTVTAASAYTPTLLVSNAAGNGAQTVDANLVNGWGVAFGTTSPVWVSNQATGTSTLYNGNGKAQPVAAPRVVGFDPGFLPTGIVFNGGTGFTVTSAGRTAAAAFIFSGEGGKIAGWAASVNGTLALTTYTDASGAVYKGLAIGSTGGASYLYATDFRNSRVDVFDSSYARQTPTATRFAFVDPALPAGYAPFGIQAVPTGTGGAHQIVIAYASKAAAGSADETVGAGLGVVSLFEADGSFVRRLVSPGGRLNAPWGIALAPADFGTLGGALMVGNFGDGKVHGFDIANGRFLGTVKSAAGTDFTAAGLWGIAFGNGAANQPRNTLFYAAGPTGETAGAYGRIDLGSTAPVLNQPPVVTLTVPAGTLTGTVALAATATSPLNLARMEFLVNGTVVGTDTTAPYTFDWDSAGVANGSITIVARATDTDGNAGSSSATTATVSNSAPPVAVSFAQLQTDIFSSCTGCHSGAVPASGALPGSMNLNSGNSYANLVNVDSLEQPALKRVLPGNAADSYLVRKLEGTAGISGARMPQGGPFFDAATIDRLKAWINAGAPNN